MYVSTCAPTIWAKIERIFIFFQKVPFTTTSSQSRGNHCSYFYSYEVVLTFLNFPMNRIRKYMLFCVWFILLSLCLEIHSYFCG
jgi:hypothetical protein